MLAASNIARQFIGIQGRESPFVLTFLPQRPKIGRIGERAGHAHLHVNIILDMCQRKRHDRDVPLVEYRAACGRRIGVCG